MKHAIYLGVIAVLVLSSSAMADMLYYEDCFISTNVGSGQTLSLPQFDTSQGQLTNVVLTLDVTFSGGKIQWDNEADVPSTVTLGVGATVSATGPGALALVTNPLQTDDGSVAADETDGQGYDLDGGGDFAGPDAFTVDTGCGVDSDTDSPASFAAYEGTGNVTIDVTSATDTFLSTSGGFGPINTCLLGSYCGKVSVTYTYVPEPTTLALIAMGGVGLFLRRRRNR
jgi:hypothetical protein